MDLEYNQIQARRVYQLYIYLRNLTLMLLVVCPFPCWFSITKRNRRNQAQNADKKFKCKIQVYKNNKKKGRQGDFLKPKHWSRYIILFLKKTKSWKNRKLNDQSRLHPDSVSDNNFTTCKLYPSKFECFSKRTTHASLSERGMLSLHLLSIGSNLHTCLINRLMERRSKIFFVLYSC